MVGQVMCLAVLVDVARSAGLCRLVAEGGLWQSVRGPASAERARLVRSGWPLGLGWTKR